MAGIAGDILDRLEAQLYAQAYSQYLSGTSSSTTYTNVVTLKFYREQLLYDIKNLGYVESDVMPAEKEHERHQVADIGEVGNVDRVTRIMDLAIAHCTELLYPYSKDAVDESEEREDTLENADTYEIAMKVPSDFSKTTVNLLEKLIHELVVCMVMADWMSITNLRNKDSAVNWASRIEDLEEEIEDTLSSVMGRVRRTQTPF